jgi:hypothetical protein
MPGRIGCLCQWTRGLRPVRRGQASTCSTLRADGSPSIPYIAGVYALAAQVEPNITPERFWALAMKTWRTIKLRHNAKEIDFGPILDPAQLIEAIRRGDLSDAAAATAELTRKSAARSVPTASQTPMPKEFAAKIDRLDIDNATHKDVIEQLGEPSSNVLGNQALDPNSLPDRYAMIYPWGVQVVIMEGRIGRITVLASGYLLHGKIQVGNSVEETFTVLGSPRQTVEGAKGQEISPKDGDDLFYKDIAGIKGKLPL